MSRYTVCTCSQHIQIAAMTTLADDTSAILDPSVLNSFGNTPGNGDDVTPEFLPGLIGGTSAITTVHHTDTKCCMWLLYLSFFLLSCVILWFIIFSLVVGFHVYRRSNTRSNTISGWIQRCVTKQRNNGSATNIQIHYHQIIQYDIAQVPLLSDVDDFGVGDRRRKGWFGASMKDYIFRRPPAPICPKLEMGPKNRGSRMLRSEDNELCDRQHHLVTYFSEKDVTRETVESPEFKVNDTDDERTVTEKEWGNNFNCKLTMNNLVQPTDRTHCTPESIDGNNSLGASTRR